MLVRQTHPEQHHLGKRPNTSFIWAE